jgi:hypothetical protein
LQGSTLVELSDSLYTEQVPEDDFVECVLGDVDDYLDRYKM